MDLEKFGYNCLGIVGAIWLAALVIGAIQVFPFGMVGIVALVGFAALLTKVVRERRNNAEDDHYSETVER